MNNAEFKKLVKKGIEGVIAQGGPSVTPYGSDCLYASEDGKCCVVGHMMPDEATRKEADSYDESGVVSLNRKGFHWIKQFNAHQIKVLSHLQGEHDSGIHSDSEYYIDKFSEKAWEIYSELEGN